MKQLSDFCTKLSFFGRSNLVDCYWPQVYHVCVLRLYVYKGCSALGVLHRTDGQLVRLHLHFYHLYYNDSKFLISHLVHFLLEFSSCILKGVKYISPKCIRSISFLKILTAVQVNSSMLKFTSNPNFLLFNDLRSDFKVEHGLWGSKCENRKILA